MSAVDAVPPAGPAAPPVALTGPSGTQPGADMQPGGVGNQSIDYMSLLLAQLKNQDPSSPMDATQMVAQTTQLGMLQQLTALAADTSQTLTLQMRSTAAALVGRTVDYRGADGATASGVVDGVTFGTSTPTVTIGGTAVGLDAVLGVTAPGPASPGPAAPAAAAPVPAGGSAAG